MFCNKDKQAHLLADALVNSMDMYTSDNQNYGLLLSGGLDSRALLAASKHKPLCFTTCPTNNNEARVASEVSQAAGCENIFIPRPKGVINDHIEMLINITSAEYSIANMQLFGYGEYIKQRANVLFLGIGLDIFFAGLYQPKNVMTFLGKRSTYFRLYKIPSNITGFFIDNIKNCLQNLYNRISTVF